ncbi:MAG: metallophosphatase family protein [Myxococcaceae bacterium]|nr:metallophosphatase family protein [Myxococcaceae bacterium]MCI0670424.1 metallophosphatase family protein [Myxococcaceae bacterium]
MRIAVLSDVHSNIEALTEVLRAAEAERVDRMVCLGDVVGYGAAVNECCELVRAHCEVTLLGNHDAAVAGRMDYSYYYDAARHALDWSASIISQENAAWLRSLPFTYRIGEVGFSHGSPVDPRAYEYIFALEQARELTPHVEHLPEVTFIGHSHLCKAFSLADGEVNDVVAQKFGLRQGSRYIVSVGSVGQPRDYDNRACFVVCDTDARTVEYRRVEYDIEASAQRIFDADLALNFGRRLFLGV